MISSATFPIRQTAWFRPAWLLVHLLVALTMIAWVAALWANEAWATFAWVPPAAAAWLLAARWRPQSAGDLRWDGQCWLLGEEVPGGSLECKGSVSLVIDAGDWMLLRYRRSVLHRPGGTFTWLLLGRDGLAHDWAALRRAVYSPRPDPAGHAAQSAAHPPA